MTDHIEKPTSAAPLACNLTGADLQARGEVARALFASAHQTRELPDGYSYAFASDTASVRRVEEFIEGERACCPFFTFELRFEPEHGPLWLTIRGSGQIKALLADTFATLIPPTATR
jgi:hypothetical protein